MHCGESVVVQLTQDQVVTLGTISLVYLAAVFVVVAAARAFIKLRKGIQHENRNRKQTSRT